MDASQQRKTSEAAELAARAIGFVGQARAIMPQLPPIRQPQVIDHGHMCSTALQFCHYVLILLHMKLFTVKQH